MAIANIFKRLGYDYDDEIDIATKDNKLSRLIIYIRNGKLCNYYMTVRGAITTQRELSLIQIDFNNFMRDLKEIKNEL